MYLREMGSVELLSREGEIAIAKRIEAGRNTYIGGLCESPLTFQAITIWREELLDEKIMLRDVIDLDATFGSMSESELSEELKIEGFENQKPTSEIRDDNLKESLSYLDKSNVNLAKEKAKILTKTIREIQK